MIYIAICLNSKIHIILYRKLGGVYPSWQIKKLWPYGIKYEGAIVYLFTGIEDKKFTGYVKVHDREPEFVAKARYYDINKLKYRKEHLYAVNKYMENK